MNTPPEPPEPQPGDASFDVQVPPQEAVPPGQKRPVLVHVRGPGHGMTVLLALRPEIARWLGESIIMASEIAASPIQIATQMPDQFKQNGHGHP